MSANECDLMPIQAKSTRYQFKRKGRFSQTRNAKQCVIGLLFVSRQKLQVHFFKITTYNLDVKKWFGRVEGCVFISSEWDDWDVEKRT